MSLLTQISIYFFYTLSFGLALFWPLVSSEQTGRGFQGLIANILLAMVMILGAINYFAGALPWNYAYLYLFLVMVSLIYISIKARDIKIFDLVSFRLKDGDVKASDHDKRDLWDWAFYILGVLGFFMWGLHAYFVSFEVGIFMMSAVLLMGVTIYMMSLGHYYLVVPKLSAKPLIVGNYILWATLLFKALFYGWIMSKNWGYFEEGSTQGDGFMMNWVFASMRVLWGFAALGSLSFFAYKLAKMRSFQSATGVLYTMVFFVFVGELLAGYFYYQMGLAL